MSYSIFTDGGSNLYDEKIKELNVKFIPIPYVVGEEERKSASLEDVKDAYARLRNREIIYTAAVGTEEIYQYFDEELSKGNDVIYVAFSSGLSVTYENGVQAVAQLKEKYPNRKIYIIDSLCAALGEGLLVALGCQLRDAGADVDKVAEYLEFTKYKLNHIFTVDDMYFLYRGGRISKATYAIAKGLSIKPLMHTDLEGHLTAIGKTLGRKKSIKVIADTFCKSVVNPQDQIVYIGHGDCLEDAETLKMLIEKKVQVKGWYIDYLCPVIGAHSGPGTLAVFYLADKRV